MKQETAAAIETHTLQLAVAWLLTQEAQRSGIPLEAVQEAMVVHFIKSTQAAGQQHPQAGLQLEVAMTQSADRLFSIAKAIQKQIY